MLDSELDAGGQNCSVPRESESGAEQPAFLSGPLAEFRVKDLADVALGSTERTQSTVK